MKWRKTHIVFIDIRWLFIKIIVTIILVYGVISYLKWTEVTAIHFKSEDLAASWQISNPKTVKAITKALKNNALIRGNPPKRGFITMRLISQRESRDYIFVNPEIIYDCEEDELLLVPEELSNTLKEVVINLKKKSPYGELMEWDKVKPQLPVGGKAVVTDLDTKVKFSIQRTGGFNHADFEPLTRQDTIKALRIYGSKWSWKRRGVVVDLGEGKKIAASLVGMPQGKDLLKDNDCPGSLGLFFHSKEITRSNNLSHQVMIWKAAGKTYELLKQLTPEETIMAIFTSLDQGDISSLKKVVKPLNTGDINKANEIIGTTVLKMLKQGEQIYRLEVSLSLRQGPYNHPKELNLQLLRDGELGIYYTNSQFLKELLK